MLDTYMDRADAATGYMLRQQRETERRLQDDPRYWAGQLYESAIAAAVARAKAALRWELTLDVNDHQIEMRHGIRLGDVRSVFLEDGRRKIYG